ncbi:MAG: TIGR04219 family outer membrane beta-barrel protein [Pontibacterium sp.]
MRKTLLASSLLISFVATPAIAAPLVDLDVGGYAWSANYDGDLGSSNTSVDDLGLDSSTSTTAYVSLEHPVPVIPNLKITSTQLDTKASSTLSSDFTIDGKTFSSNTDVTTQVDLAHTDFTVFYGLPELAVDIDFGLTFRVFDGEVMVTETNNSSNSKTVDLDFVLPMGYASARFNLPGTGFFVDGAINGLAIDGNSITDTTGRVGYSKSLVPAVLDLEVSLGYRKFQLNVEEDDITAEASASGPFANLSVVF